MDNNNNNNFNPQQPNGSFNNPNVTPQDYQAQNYQSNFDPNFNQNNFNQPPYGGPVGPQDPGKGLAIASMVCGIAGLVLAWFSGTGLVPGIVGLILAIMSGNKSQAVGLKRSGMATAGLVCSIISLALSAIMLVCFICTCTALASTPSYYYYY